MVYGALTAVGGLGLTSVMQRTFTTTTNGAPGAAVVTPHTCVPTHAGMACAAIAAVTAHIASFNLLIPILAQDYHHWRPSIFAAVDACFGVGAFGAVLLLLRNTAVWSTAMTLGLVASTVLLAVCSQVAATMMAAVALGYCANVIRIRHREALYDAQVMSGDAHMWSSRLVLSVMVARSLTPLMLGSVVNIVAAPLLCGASALASGGVIVASTHLRRRASRQHETARQLAPAVPVRSATGT